MTAGPYWHIYVTFPTALLPELATPEYDYRSGGAWWNRHRLIQENIEGLPSSAKWASGSGGADWESAHFMYTGPFEPGPLAVRGELVHTGYVVGVEPPPMWKPVRKLKRRERKAGLTPRTVPVTVCSFGPDGKREQEPHTEDWEIEVFE